MLEFVEGFEFLLTHSLVPSGPIPSVHDPDGIYPYESYCETSKRPHIARYRMITIESDHLRVKICPDLGGRVCSLYLKQRDVETLFFPSVVRPVRILPRQAFTGGGIEVSFPISHSPVEIFPVHCEVVRERGRIYVSCGERELKFGMNWSVEFSLGESDAFLTQRTVFFNPANEDHPWMSWSNAGVPSRPDTIFDFPDGPVLVHEHQLRVIDWSSQGPRQQSDLQRMTGFFWQKPDCCVFGVFTPSLQSGLYHVADPAQTPGIKLWSDGIGCDERWVSQYTLDGQQCLEIQAGPLIDQSMKAMLAPRQLHQHTEFWIPSDSRRDIRTIELPRPILRDIEAVPRFGWAQNEGIRLWLELLSRFQSKDVERIPDAPDVDSNDWAPSGMELGGALAWAASTTSASEKDKWLLQEGAWLGGRGEIKAALEVLARSADDRAHALAGRLWFIAEHDANAAVECYRKIGWDVVALHPQVVFERDRALEALGKCAFEERQRWLEAVSALDDEWLIERRASLLLDRNDAQAAFHLMKNTRFQMVHQRHARTRLWRRIEAALGLEPVEYPSWLGEDDLADFGAYREHQED